VTPTFVSPFVKAQKADVANGAMGWVGTKVQAVRGHAKSGMDRRHRRRRRLGAAA
jgi:hypothetical protein